MGYFPREKDPNDSLGHGDICLEDEGQGEVHCGHEVGYSIGGGSRVCHEIPGLKNAEELAQENNHYSKYQWCLVLSYTWWLI